MNDAIEIPVLAPVSGTSQAAMDIQNNPEFLMVPPEDKQQIMGQALAIVIAKMLPIPSAPVEGVFSYYRSNNEMKVRELVSKFNETFIVNVTEVSSLVYALWSVRYNALHTAEVFLAMSPVGLFETFMGVNLVVDETMYKAVNKCPCAVLSLSNQITRLFTKVAEPAPQG